MTIKTNYTILIAALCDWLKYLAPVETSQKQNQNREPVAQLVEHRDVMREVVSSTPAGPTLRVLK